MESLQVQDQRLPTSVFTLLEQYVELLQRKLPELVQTVAIYGSISLNAFDEKNSDVDFVAVVARSLTAEELEMVKELHQELARRNPFASRLDGFYIPVEDLREGVYRAYPYFRESVYQGDYQFGSLYRLQLNKAITVWGAALEVKLPEWQEIEREMSYNINEYWAGKVKQPEIFEDDEWVPFAVLTFLRIEHTLRHKEIISKRQAGELALQSVDGKWHRLIRESLRIQYEQDEQSLYASKAERVAEVLVFAEEYTWVCNQLFA